MSHHVFPLPSPHRTSGHRGHRRGFSLIEVLVVVVVFSVLAAIAWVNLNGAKEQAQLAAMTADLRAAALYEEVYASEHDGNYFSGIAASDAPLHGFRPSAGVTVTLTAFLTADGSRPGWSGVARHVGTEKQCELTGAVGTVKCGPPEQRPPSGVIASN